MSNKAQIKEEIRLRVEEIEAKLQELTLLANANDENFFLPTVDKEFYCDHHIKTELSYLSDYHSEDGKGAWLTSSDFC